MAEGSLDCDADSGQASDDENQRLELQELLQGEQLSDDEEQDDSVSDGEGSLSTSQEWGESHVLSGSQEWEESRPLPSHKEQEPSIVLTSYLTSHANLEEESHVMPPSSCQDQGAKHVLGSLQERQGSGATIPPSQSRDGSHMLTSAGPPPLTSQDPHIFAGTSQEYELLPPELPAKPVPLVPCRPAAADNPPRVHFAGLPYEQLEALYAAQKRRIKELEESAAISHRETEQEAGSLRHQTRQLLEERDRLLSQLAGCQQLYLEVQQSLAAAHDELAKKGNLLQEVSASKEQLMAELGTARLTIDGLRTQVAQLGSSEVIEKLRLNYDSALLAAKEQHAQEVAHLQTELGSVQEQLHQMMEKKRFEQESPEQHPMCSSSADANSADNSRPSEQSERYLELAAESEDLCHQLSVLQEELQQMAKRAQLAESKVAELNTQKRKMAEASTERVRELEGDIQVLKQKLQEAGAIAEHQKRVSLEQCRKACLKLHEEAIERLRTQLHSEKQLLMQEHRSEIRRLQEELGRTKGKLATTQDQYVAAAQQLRGASTPSSPLLSLGSRGQKQKVANAKAAMSEKASVLTSDQQEQKERHLQKQIQLAVAAAHRIWQGEQQAAAADAVQNALRSEREQARKNLEKERSTWDRERDDLHSQVKLIQAEQRTAHEAHQQRCAQLQADLKASLQSLTNEVVQLFIQFQSAQTHSQ